jgi:hypothetical protein
MFALRKRDRLVRAGVCAVEMLEGRYLLSGPSSGPMSLDPTFGSGGILELPDEGWTVAGVRADGTYVTADSSSPNEPLLLHRADGSVEGPLTPGDGISTSWFNNTTSLPDGKLLMTGPLNGTTESVLYSIDLNGTRDMSFGNGGELRTGLNGVVYTVQARDGKIVVAGISDNAMIVKRYSSEGTPDLSFGTGGVMRMDLSRAVPQPSDLPRTVVTQLQWPIGIGVRPDGRIVVGFDSKANDRPGQWVTENDYFIFVQLLGDGMVDQRFGENGVAPRAYSYEGAWSVKMELLPDGYIAAMWGSVYSDNEIDFFDPNGGGAGSAWIGEVPGTFDVGPDGKVIGVGGLDVPTIGRGSPTAGPRRSYSNDPSFDVEIPSVLLPGPIPPHPESFLRTVAVQDDGKILALGIRGNGPAYLFRFEGDAHGSYPFHGIPADGTQLIQAEDFDLGAEGAAYHDADSSNRAGAYRTTGVDVGYTNDNGPAIGVGYTQPGEWLNYTVNVTQAGAYQFDVRAASQGSGGMFHMEVDGKDVTGEVTVPDTGSWSDWRTIETPASQLDAGTHVVRLVMDSAGPSGAIGNFDWFAIAAANPGGGDGLSATYYDNIDFSGPTVRRVDPNVNFDWSLGSPAQGIGADTFSVVWTGQVQAEHTGQYTFYTQSDDGVRLYVDGKLLIDHLTPQAATEYSATIDLAAGVKYDIQMLYFDRYGEAVAKLLWSGPSTPQGPVPTSALFSLTDAQRTDVEAPSQPRATLKDVTSTHVTLTWTRSTDNVGVAAYDIYRDDQLLATVGTDVTEYSDPTVLIPDTVYDYRVVARDAAGNVSSYGVGVRTDVALPGDGLTATYYRNIYFIGPPITRIDPTIDFDWGLGSPATGIAPDTFSVRWRGQVQAPATGSYTFSTDSDDGVRLWVNGQLLIDHLTPQGEEEWSGSINLEGGKKYDIRLDYFDRYGEAVAKLSWTGPAIAKQIIPQSALFSTAPISPPDTQNGLLATYFDNMDLTGPAVQRRDHAINFDWSTGSPIGGVGPDTFSVLWEGQIQAPADGLYTFYTSTDDGVRLWIDNQLVIDHWDPQPETEWSGQVQLAGNSKHRIQMEYFDRYGEAVARLMWSGPGISRQIVPQAALFS